MEGKWSGYRAGQFIGRRMVMLQNGGRMVIFTEVNSLMEGEWLCYGGGQFNGGRKVMLGGQFNGGRMVMLQK